MSVNDIPTTLGSVEKLIQRTISAERSNQKEIRLTIQEAKDIAIELSLLTSKLGKHIQDIHTRLDKLTVQSDQIDVKMDGGTF